MAVKITHTNSDDERKKKQKAYDLRKSIIKSDPQMIEKEKRVLRESIDQLARRRTLSTAESMLLFKYKHSLDELEGRKAWKYTLEYDEKQKKHVFRSDMTPAQKRAEASKLKASINESMKRK